MTVPMIIATRVMKPGRMRVGKIGNNITLPRTVAVVTLVAGAIGALVGAAFGLVLGPSVRTILFGAVFGGGLGVLVVNYSPIEGESLLKWAGLSLRARRQQIYVNGQPTRLAIGICPVSRSAHGPVRIRRGAVTVPPSQYDERGVLIAKRNHNLHAAPVSDIIADLFEGHAAPLFPIAAAPSGPSRRTLGTRRHRSLGSSSGSLR